MNKRELKQLAEQHYFCGRKLTMGQYTLLKESEYADILNGDNVDSEFNATIKDFLPSIIDDHQPAAKETVKFNHDIDTSMLQELAADIEMNFKLGIPSHADYRGTDLNKVKMFIKKFVSENHCDHHTHSFIENLMQKAELHLLLLDLYMHCQ
jgi:hypothetical protein